MIDKDLLQAYPLKRLKPIDGLSVTADVWDEAHEYHRQRQRYHALIAHGVGIVAGLEVIASDPADSQVYILPGMAISPTGDEIVLTQAVSYDIGKAQGMLYLMLTYGESKPSPDQGSSDSARLYVYSGFEVEARPELPAGSTIEIARIKRVNKDSPITDASDPMHPGNNQIDQRFRSLAGASKAVKHGIGVCYMPGVTDKGHGKGFDHVIKAAGASGAVEAFVDDDIALAAGIDQYALVHLVGQGKFQIAPNDMNVIYGYLQSGGTLFIESARGSTASGEPAADAVFLDMLSSFGLQLQDITPGHELLQRPNLFGAIPAGFESQGKPRLQDGGGVIFSTYDFGSLWQGLRRGAPAAREDIRSAHEFGANIVAYAISRRTAAQKTK